MATNGADWFENENWLSDVSIREWHGVSVDSRGRVTGISLRLNDLTGAIPPEIGYLTNLKSLDLSSNELHGVIPRELGNLTRLETLDLRSNKLSGRIPLELGNLANLKELDVANTQLSGYIPLEWYKRLGQGLQFSGTQLKLPPDDTRDALTALYNATNGPSWENNENWLSTAPFGEWHGVTVDGHGEVTELDLSSNRLSGEIPPELGNLAKLETLYLYSNQLSREIPPELGDLAKLKTLHLSSNQLSGKIPPELSNLANLEWLYLSSNQLSGEIPRELGKLGNLIFAFLDDNQLTGKIPPELDNLTVDLSGNHFDPPPFEGKSDREALFAIHSNTKGLNWSRDIPLGMWEGVTINSKGRVTGLDLSQSQMSGEIPPELAHLSSLRYLSLFLNQLSGEIPPELARLSSLRYLNLSRNELSGEIPPELSRLANLSILSLSRNRLSGEIPPELSRLANLSILSLTHNRLSGEIPPELGRLSNLRRLYLNDNSQLTGCIPSSLQGQLEESRSPATYSLGRPFCR